MTATTILCIRHGQSTFNAAWAATGADPMHYDARLSALGREQVVAARATLLAYPVEIVLVSPLTRAIETALGVFDGHPNAPAMRISSLIPAALFPAQFPSRRAISAQGLPGFRHREV